MKLLNKHREAFYSHSSADTAASVDRIINETNITLEMPKVLNDIYYKLGSYQRETKDEKGYFDQEFLEKVRTTFNRYRVLMYNYGIRERSLNKDYVVVVNSLNSLEEKIPANDRRNIKNLLVSAKKSNQGALEISMKEFEQDEAGNKVFIDQSRLKESLEEKFDKEGLKYFEETMIVKLRNPK